MNDLSRRDHVPPHVYVYPINDTWSISGNVIGSETKMNILVKVLSGLFPLENVAPWKRRTNPVVGICRRYWLSPLQSPACERHAKKEGNFDFLCLLLVSCNSVQQEIVKKWKKNYWALFWYINQLVPCCMEATVVLNVWTVFVPNIDLYLWSSGTLWSSSSVYPQTFEFLLSFAGILCSG